MTGTANLSLHDVFKIALANETLGAKFYGTMAFAATDKKAKEVFNKLADQKEEQQIFFQRLMDGKEYEISKEGLSNNKSMYFKFLAKNNILATLIEAFKEQDRDFTDIELKDALSVGIQAEKDSILLYYELLDGISDQSFKQIITGLLDKGKVHLLELRQQLENI